MIHMMRPVVHRQSIIYKYRRLCCAALCLMAAWALCCTKTSPVNPRSIDLSGKWRVAAGDSMNFARADYDDSRFGVVDIPGDWSDRCAGREDMALVLWLRKKVNIGAEFRDARLLLSLGHIGLSDEVYFNGVFIGGSGTIPGSEKPLEYASAWKKPRYYAVPGPLIKYGGPNIVAVRAYSHVVNGMTGRQRIVEMQQGWSYDSLLADYIPWTINTFSLSLCSVFFFIFMAQFLANRNRPVYLLFALIVFAGALFNLCFMPLPLVLPGLARIKLMVISYASISFLISLTMQEIFDVRFRYSSALVIITLLVLSGFVIAAPTTRFLVRYCGVAAVLSVLACQGYTGFIFFRTVTFDLRRYWLLFFMVPVAFSAIRNAYYLLSLRFNDVYLSIFLHVPVLIVIATMFFFYDYEYQKRNGESIYQSLLKKSRKLKRDLDRAKKIDAKPEPHELMNGLIEYLDENFSETYERKELSRKFGLNENYMVQLFKKRTGETISNYINARRIERAKQLLADGDNKIIDIAFHVGFENYTHFHRQFRKATGMTPRDYRERGRG